MLVWKPCPAGYVRSPLGWVGYGKLVWRPFVLTPVYMCQRAPQLHLGEVP